jgi:hypothetical protein
VTLDSLQESFQTRGPGTVLNLLKQSDLIGGGGVWMLRLEGFAHSWAIILRRG